MNNDTQQVTGCCYADVPADFESFAICPDCNERTTLIDFKYEDGEPAPMQIGCDGMLTDTPERYAVNYVSHYSGKVLQTRDYKNIADAHAHCEELRDKGLWAEVVVVEISEDEYEPNFNGFISTVTPKEIATVGLVVLMFISIWIAT